MTTQQPPSHDPFECDTQTHTFGATKIKKKKPPPMHNRKQQQQQRVGTAGREFPGKHGSRRTPVTVGFVSLSGTAFIGNKSLLALRSAYEWLLVSRGDAGVLSLTQPTPSPLRVEKGRPLGYSDHVPRPRLASRPKLDNGYGKWPL